MRRSQYMGRCANCEHIIASDEKWYEIEIMNREFLLCPKCCKLKIGEEYEIDEQAEHDDIR